MGHNNGLLVAHCWACGYAHQFPLPNKKEVEAYYNNDEFYSDHASVDWFEKEECEHKAELWNVAYDWRLKKLATLHSRHPISLVDMGAGAGWFMQRATQSGCQSLGVEPSKVAREFINRHNSPLFRELRGLFPGTKELQYLIDFKGVLAIHASLVLEHLLDPLQFLETCKNFICPVLPDGIILHTEFGRLMLIVPNEFNPLQNRIRKEIDKDWFIQKPHINYFTRASLLKLLEKCGWQVTFQGATFPMELFWLIGQKYIGNDEVGRRCHIARLKWEKALGPRVFDLYGLLFRKLGWGREIVMVAKPIGELCAS